jgi:hypothetical protein
MASTQTRDNHERKSVEKVKTRNRRQKVRQTSRETHTGKVVKDKTVMQRQHKMQSRQTNWMATQWEEGGWQHKESNNKPTDRRPGNCLMKQNRNVHSYSLCDRESHRQSDTLVTWTWKVLYTLNPRENVEWKKAINLESFRLPPNYVVTDRR